MNARIRTRTTPDYTAVDIPAILLRVARKHAPVALAAVLAEWPVESGTSRAGWDVDVLQEGATVRLVLVNRVAYAQYVTAPGSRSPIAQTVAADALRKAQALLDADAEQEIAAALRAAPRRTR